MVVIFCGLIFVFAYWFYGAVERKEWGDIIACMLFIFMFILMLFEQFGLIHYPVLILGDSSSSSLLLWGLIFCGLIFIFAYWFYGAVERKEWWDIIVCMLFIFTFILMLLNQFGLIHYPIWLFR